MTYFMLLAFNQKLSPRWLCQGLLLKTTIADIKKWRGDNLLPSPSIKRMNVVKNATWKWYANLTTQDCPPSSLVTFIYLSYNYLQTLLSNLNDSHRAWLQKSVNSSSTILTYSRAKLIARCVIDVDLTGISNKSENQPWSTILKNVTTQGTNRHK